MSKRVIIIGGVAGGASAATRLRRLNEEASIVLIERGPDVSFANCGLPYHIGQVIEHRSDLLVTTPQRLRERFNLDVRTRTEAVSIDRAAKQVSLKNLDSGEIYQESYDDLILSTGASPLRPPLPGLDLPGVHVLRNLQDTDHIVKGCKGAQRALVVGAGFIGLEMVENLRHLQLNVTLVELADQVLPPLDREMTSPIEECLKKQGVDVRLGDALTAIEQSNGHLRASFKSGRSLEVDLIILGIGVRPENRLAVEAGLAVGTRGGVVVNQQLQTSDPSIYAVGDLIEVRDWVSGRPTQIPLAGPANRQGRLAADAICDRKVNYRGTQGTAIVGVFDLTAACTGLSEKLLKSLEIPHRKVYIHPNQHAGYYPGAKSLSLKLLYCPTTGKVLGAQAVGPDGVDKRIDVLAMAIQAGMTVYDLEEVELCYAPPYGSAKDPVNMAGFVAANQLRGDHPQVAVENLGQAQHPEYLIDVRTPKEYAEGHIPQAVNIPLDELRARLGEIPADRELAVYCQVGLRGYLATRILLQKGFRVHNLSGGYRTYRLHHSN